MPTEITMPQLSDTMSEGTVVKWLKKEGEPIKAGEIIAEIETDKATMEMESFESGTLAHIAVPEGGKVDVGAAIAVLATGKEDPVAIKKKFAATGAPVSTAVAASASKQPASAPAPKVAEQAASVLASAGGGGGVAASGGVTATMLEAISGEMHEPDDVGHHATIPTGDKTPFEVAVHPTQANGERLRVSPLARRIAEDRKVDLTRIKGSGPGGRIIQRDVIALEQAPAAPRPVAPSPAARPPAGQKTVIPLTKMRSVIALRLQQSKQTIPHFYETIDIDVEDLSALRLRINAQLETEKVRLSIGDFVAKAVSVALLRHPALNATFDGKEITRHGSVNLGMAVALPEGLIVPVVRGIEQLGLKEIRRRSADLVDRARGQRLKQDEMSGATFSVSNLGTFGVREFSAIINPPEVGILAIAAAEKRAVVRGDAIVARTMMSVTLSADHRAVDGATAAEFLRTLKNLLEEPGMMLV